MGKIVSPADAESSSTPSHERRSQVAYKGEVRAGLGSVSLDKVAAKPKKTDKKIDNSPSIP